MTELLHQLSELVLGSVPTMVLFLCTLFAYRILVHNPLTRALAERHQRTQGAVEKASAAIATAEARMTEYEQKLSAARGTIFRAREERLRILQAEADKTTEAARLAAHHRVLSAREELEKSSETAQLQMRASIEQLGALALARVLAPTTAGRERA